MTVQTNRFPILKPRRAIEVGASDEVDARAVRGSGVWQPGTEETGALVGRVAVRLGSCVALRR